MREVWASGSPDARHGVDVTDTFERGVASLQAHDAYLAGLEGHPDVAEFLAEWARLAGDRLRCTYAASFEVYPIRLL